jgi:subtilisin family serine protease
MTPEEKFKILSNDFADLIVEYDGNERLLENYRHDTVQIMNNRFAIAYIPAAQITGRSLSQLGYAVLPACYGLVSEKSLDASGVNRIRTLPSFQLKGQGVLVGIVDTGIDYTNPAFLHKDGTSKIISIWDQTIDSEDRYPGGGVYGEGIVYGEATYLGTEYTREQINQALSSNKPYEVVPSKDELGHGTMLAGIAAGSELSANNFSGVAPASELVIVKLKQAKESLRNFLLIPPDVPCYQENDIMWGVQYLTRVARQLSRPIAICIGLGSAQGNHDGMGALSSLLTVAGNFPGVCITIAAGNEGNTKRHYFGEIDSSDEYKSVELIVGDSEPGFAMEFWGMAPGSYSISIISPSGEQIPRIQDSLFFNREVSFLFERTRISVNYQSVETESGAYLIQLRFQNPTPGIWKFNVYGGGDLPGSFHIWLPSDDFISAGTYFIEYNSYTTITSPGNSILPITVTAYDVISNSLYRNASKGYSNANVVKPDLAAPGVDIPSPTIEHDFKSVTGTSVAAAHTAGVTALMLEWGILKGNYKGITTVEIKKFLIRGAVRSPNLIYPNRDWGFGRLDIYNSFNILRSGI